MENINAIKRVRIQLVPDGELLSKESLNTPEKVVEYIGKQLSGFDREAFAVINLDTKLQPLNMSIVSVGTLDQSLVHPREVFKSSILSNASGIVTLHNHPSGTLKPSKEDIDVFHRLDAACTLLGFRYYDNLIVGFGQNEYYSFRQYDTVEFGKAEPYKDLLKVAEPELRL